MNKRKEENLRVKRDITNTLFSLMAEKSLADIHISELVSKAGVARASFYRNYSSKEDVLITLIRDILDEFREEIDLEQGSIYDYENVLLIFRRFQKYRSHILDLQRTGFSSLLLEEVNSFHESIDGSMPYGSIEKFKLYMYVGALMNTAVTWLSDGERFSAEEIARYFVDAADRLRGEA